MSMLSEIARINVHSLSSTFHLPMTASDSQPTESIIDEKHKLLTLESQLHIYKDATAELTTYLHGVFSVVGGISALPLSNATKSVVERSNPGTLASPLSPNFRVASTKVFSALQLESLSADTHENTADNDMTVLVASRNTGADCSIMHTTGANKSTLSCGDTTETTQNKLEAQISELQQIINEQRLEIEDLTETRREYIHEVHKLRKQLKDIKSAGDTRRFVKAWDSAGLTRTPSMLYLPNATMSLWRSASRRGKQSTSETDSYKALDAALSTKASMLASSASATNRLSRIASSASLDSHLQDTSSRISSIDDARRPSGFINGWPIYDSDNGTAIATQSNEGNPATQQSQVIDIELPIPSVLPSKDELTQLASSQPVQSTLPHQESVGSGLSACLTDTSSLAPPAARTPRLFRTIVAKTPRRIYSKLNGRLKKA
ncbi:hypothetical protein COEREDRAFT_6610 [Coemansia reversa NRRL 1564]|uniref:Uncharacterized protein n=1 Tax=Coemansia reversa (strain ATCC 12441 / NRRL 1564) TaxID=763665 RepID=A0A2G5BH70_COERN|nr:hypothetical protein COEREDRAFT_6610 [Coemansia reversa NRRL 1564]|eukprot:PIA18374.1 hypothetical protein COEREDRAFT_6610 [Coemansia reversa NRRL 1564]